MSSKKKPKRRTDVERPYSGGNYSLADFRSFAMSALRRARWGPKCDAIKRAFTRKGINPLTGKPCMLHKCEECGEEFPKGVMRADHIHPVIPILHDWQELPNNFLGYDFNEVMRRLWVEEDGFQILCTTCHQQLTNKERASRRMQWDEDCVSGSPAEP